VSITLSGDLHQIQQIGKNAVDVAFKATPLFLVDGLVEDVSGLIASAGSNSIEFSVWKTDLTGMTQDAVRNSRTGVTPSKLTLESYNEPAETKVISVDGDRFALEDSSESAMKHLASVVGREFSRVLQDKLIAQALDPTDGTDLVHDISATGTIDVNAILDARLKWGDRASDLGTPYLFVRTKQFSDLAKNSDYKAMVGRSTVGPVSAEGDWSHLVVGQVYGVNIILLDSLPTGVISGDPDITFHTAMLVCKGAFGMFIGDAPDSVVVNHAGSAVKTIDSHFRYATTLFRHNPRRVVKLITQ